jgi:uncharacterized coiled-coil protein SlyX
MSNYWRDEDGLKPNNGYIILSPKEHSFKHFLLEQFNQIKIMIQTEVQQVLDAVDGLETKVSSLETAFTAQQASIDALNTTVAGLSLSDADKATIAADLKKVQDSSASIDTILHPTPPPTTGNTGTGN